MLASRAVKLPPPRDTSNAARSALRCLLGALVVFVLNLGGFGNTVAREVNKTDEAAYQSGAAFGLAELASGSSGDDTPDPLLPTASTPDHAWAVAATLGGPKATVLLPLERRGPFARAPPLQG